MPEDGMIAGTEIGRQRRTNVTAKPKVKDNNEEKSRKERSNPPWRRDATPEEWHWHGSRRHAAGFPSSVSFDAATSGDAPSAAREGVGGRPSSIFNMPSAISLSPMMTLLAP